MTRKVFSIDFLVFATCAMLMLTSCNQGAKGGKETLKPNIVIIYVDDLGYSDLESYGAVGVKTPHINQLDQMGIRFQDAHSSAATCTPSRFALLTGSYAFRSGARILPGDAPLLIEPGTPTIASMLKEAGYRTAVIGKWHLGLGDGSIDWNGEIKPGPLEIGFDHCYLIPATGDRVPCVWIEDHHVVGLDPNDPIRISYSEMVGDLPTGLSHPELLKQEADTQHSGTIINGISRIGYMTGGTSAWWKDEEFADVLTTKANEFITSYRNEPFFLFFSYHDIHVPRVVHPRFEGASEMGPRGDAIAQMDWCTGEIIRSLKENGLLEKTLIIFTSDNGPVLNDGYVDRAEELAGDHDPSGPFRGGKYSSFEAGTRVPTIVAWPGTIMPGISDALISQVDIYASLAELLGHKLEPGEAPDSHSLLDTWTGRTSSGREMMVEEASSLSLRKGSWKYIVPTSGGLEFLENKNIETGRSPEPQLYNLDEDLGEQHNLADEYPEKVREMASLLQGIIDRGSSRSETPFVWNNANIYFLLTDRFYNGDTSNDLNFGRIAKTAKLRGFEGGDMKGVIQKINEGYFDKLGITALWLTPYFEQIHGNTDEGSGVTYGYHGYWTKDWTSIDPNFGTEEDLFNLVETAHSHGIRVVMDVIINHTGPVTDKDPVWPDQWIRTGPKCTYESYETTVTCTLVDNLPDIRTESEGPVDLPPQLLEKWEEEGRLEKEMAELDAFFERTGYTRAPRYYIIKWLTDVIRKFGIDGYRLDTAKHIEEGVWSELGNEARIAFRDWKKQHPDKVLDDNDFYMVAEVYGYSISSGRNFSFGDRDVDFFAHAIHSMINFEFKYNATGSYEKLFSAYSDQLNGVLEGKGVLNYMTSHDDGEPFDKERIKPMEAATKLLLSPGASQVYYGDESCRELIIPGTNGDATLRGLMNWEEIESDASRNGYSIREVMEHYQKLGTFRSAHPSVGAGVHRMITETPYVFSRSFTKGKYSDHVVVGLDLEPGEKSFEVGELFEDGTWLFDSYSGKYAMVKKGKIEFASAESIVLLGQK